MFKFRKIELTAGGALNEPVSHDIVGSYVIAHENEEVEEATWKSFSSPYIAIKKKS